MRLPLRLALALGAATALLLHQPALALVGSPDSTTSATSIRILPGRHAAAGKLDQLHILCTDDGDRVDLALPVSWIRFLVRHVEEGQGHVKLDDDHDLDLGLLWGAIEDLGPGEELVIEDGESRVAIWLE